MPEDEDILDALPPPIPWDHESWPVGEPTPDFFWAVFQMELTDDLLNVQATFREFARQAEFERITSNSQIDTQSRGSGTDRLSVDEPILRPMYDVVAIKAFFIHENVMPFPGEHMFLTNVFTDGKEVTGILAAGSPTMPGLSAGTEVRFPVERVSDWFLVRGGKGLGGFTLPYVWKTLTEEERQAYASEAPFTWFAYRGQQTAAEQLMALPVCSQCQKRDLGSPDSQATVCSICASGSWRCDCPRCGSPLIRNKELPEVCVRCASYASTS